MAEKRLEVELFSRRGTGGWTGGGNGPGQVTLTAGYVKGAGRFEVDVYSAPEMWVWRVERIMNWALA